MGPAASTQSQPNPIEKTGEPPDGSHEIRSSIPVDDDKNKGIAPPHKRTTPSPPLPRPGFGPPPSPHNTAPSGKPVPKRADPAPRPLIPPGPSHVHKPEPIFQTDVPSQNTFSPPSTSIVPVSGPPSTETPIIEAAPQQIGSEDKQYADEVDPPEQYEEASPTADHNYVQGSNQKHQSPQTIPNDDMSSESAVDSDTSSTGWSAAPPHSTSRSNPQEKPNSDLDLDSNSTSNSTLESNSDADQNSDSKSGTSISGTAIIIQVVCIVVFLGLLIGLLVLLILRYSKKKERDSLVSIHDGNVSASKNTQPTQSSGISGRQTSDIMSFEAATNQYNHLHSTRSNVDKYAIPIPNFASMQPCYPTIPSLSRDSGYGPQRDSCIWTSAVEPRNDHSICTATPSFVSPRGSVGDLSLFAPTVTSSCAPASTMKRGRLSPMTMSKFAGCTQGSGISACVDSKFSDPRPPAK
ncbi:unnamed protein product [Albugo candida]|uniref:Uncharacterized protein n=1 Tax=Albugo candida TaxID=65357 RepID=A0A024G1U0_9STRA|nr:unnamed protein product [Albugo candida]|eukprot:CCI40625.1 unnamed protein product [Albugo candida]